LPRALRSLQQAGLEVLQVLPISDLHEQPAQGLNWLQQGVDVVIAAGGDGVIGGTINHIAGSGLPLGILPLGTSNDIARSLGIPLQVGAAASVLAAGQTRNTDLGAVYHYDLSCAPGVLPAKEYAPTYGYFAHVLTIGLNVHFAQIATNVATRRRYGRLTYPIAALEVLRNPEILPVHLQFAGLQLPPHARRPYLADWQSGAAYAELSSRALQITVINAPIFGGAWQITLPGSSLDDSVLDIVVFEEAGSGQLNARLATFFRSPPLTTVTRREHRGAERFLQHSAELSGLPGIHHLQASGVVISTECDPQPATLDGEIRAQTPLYVQLRQHFLPIYVPGTTTRSGC
jgi:diacylglycerol kinase family enzyme